MIKLLFVGDVMLGRLVNEAFKYPFKAAGSNDYEHARMILKRRGVSLPPEGLDWDYPWGNTLNIFKSSDLRIINLETCITTGSEKFPGKVFNYRMHPGNVDILKVAQIDYCSLANNHIIDYGIPGMFESMETLKSANIKFAGVGSNIAEAMKPAFVSAKGKTFAIFSFSDHGCGSEKPGHPDLWAAEKNKPGFNFIDVSRYDTKNDPLNLRKLLAAPKVEKQADAVVFSIHWGPNYSWMPKFTIANLAHFLIDECGVDIIHGHSSHHIQGIEIYKGKPIIYGCGDFIDDYSIDKEFRNDRGLVYVVNLDEKLLKFESINLYPTVIDGFQAKLALDIDYKWVSQKMISLCGLFGTKVIEHATDHMLEILNQ